MMQGIAASSSPPGVVDGAADLLFRDLARSRGYDPDDLWLGGYVAYEWDHIRHFFLSPLVGPLPGRSVLEFGSNVGATSIVLAAMGACVTAVEVSREYYELGKANAKRFGASTVDFHHVPDTTGLPFPSRSFSLVSCNSVLEYVPFDLLPAVARELDRVLEPGGLILVNGTSNRLWPKEIHSRRWLTNYLPRRFDSLLPSAPQRGVFPSELRRCFPGFRDLLAENRGALLDLKREMGASPAKLRVLRAIESAISPFGISLGSALPNIAMLLRKP